MSSTPKEYSDWQLRHRTKGGVFRLRYKNLRDAMYRYLCETGYELPARTLVSLVADGDITNMAGLPYKNGLPGRPEALSRALKGDDRFTAIKTVSGIFLWRAVK